MAMQKVHNNIDWENYPSIKTPVNKQNLNAMDVSIDQIDDRVIVLDTTKLDKADAQHFVKSITLDRATGVFTITYYNGSFDIIDTLLEKIAVNFGYNATTQKLSITLDNGTVEYIDLSALVTQYEFLDSDTIAFQVQPDGKIKAVIKKGSITEEYLQPNYLADIRVEVAKAQQSATQAVMSASSAADSATLSESWAVGGTGTRTGEDTDNSKYYSQQSKNSSDSAKETLKDVVQAGNDAVDKINNAFKVIAPTFRIDFTTGHMLYDAEKLGYIFLINHTNGHLEWGLTM